MMAWVRYQGGAVRGVAYRLSKRTREQKSVDDDTLLQKVRSEVIGPLDSPTKGDLEVSVAGGTVTVGGIVGTNEDRTGLLELISEVDGVRRVRDRVEVARG
jgi:osmotically-inducible protein OsmY